MLPLFPLDVLDGIWDLIEPVPEGFLTYSCMLDERSCEDPVTFCKYTCTLKVDVYTEVDSCCSVTCTLGMRSSVDCDSVSGNKLDFRCCIILFIFHNA